MSEIVKRENGAVVSTGPLALLAGGRAETAKALVKAVENCSGVEKHSENTFHKYKYASADAIIEVGRKALAAAGLALLPMEASLNGSEREGPDRFELVRTFVLLHSSGEITPMRVVWPVIPDRGRPLDKATAAADTLSLSYLLRDLLMMPRVDPADDVNGREDRPKKEQPAKEQPKAFTGKLFEAMVKKDQALTKAGVCKKGELLNHLSRLGSQAEFGAKLEAWQGSKATVFATDAIKRFEEFAKQSCTLAQEKEIDAMFNKLEMSAEDYDLFLSENGVAEGEVMTERKARDIIAELKKLVAAEKVPARQPGDEPDDEIPY